MILEPMAEDSFVLKPYCHTPHATYVPTIFGHRFYRVAKVPGIGTSVTIRFAETSCSSRFLCSGVRKESSYKLTWRKVEFTVMVGPEGPDLNERSTQHFLKGGERQFSKDCGTMLDLA